VAQTSQSHCVRSLQLEMTLLAFSEVSINQHFLVNFVKKTESRLVFIYKFIHHEGSPVHAEIQDR